LDAKYQINTTFSINSTGNEHRKLCHLNADITETIENHNSQTTS